MHSANNVSYQKFSSIKSRSNSVTDNCLNFVDVPALKTGLDNPKLSRGHKKKMSGSLQYKTQPMLKVLGREDSYETRRKAEGFKVFFEAYENYCNNGYSGPDLHSKAMSQYSNWVACEWSKPEKFSDEAMPFIKKKTT